MSKNLFCFGTNNALPSVSGKTFRELILTNMRVRLKACNILKILIQKLVHKPKNIFISFDGVPIWNLLKMLKKL